MRAYYSVAPVLDVDRYEIENENRALVLGVRELDQNGITASDRNWSNLHTVYTHGNGVIAAYANQRPADNSSDDHHRDPVGRGAGRQPGRADQAVPRRLREPRLLRRAEPGLLDRRQGRRTPRTSSSTSATSAARARTPTPRRPRRTTATAASRSAACCVRLLYAVRFSDPNFLLSERVNENSKVLYYREPLERVEKLAPWLTLDSDPYPAVVDGRILWIVDGYTTTDRYPLSQRDSFADMIDDSLRRTTRRSGRCRPTRSTTCATP